MPSSFQQQFGGTPLGSGGSVFGLRTWSIELTDKARVVLPDRLARRVRGNERPDELIECHIEQVSVLKGLNRYEWEPGENIAKCLKPPIERVQHLPHRSKLVWTPKHNVTDPRCECGFYAYFTKNMLDLNVASYTNAVGIIEGYGPTTIGTAGFRTSKAKIRALYPFAVIGQLTVGFQQLLRRLDVEDIDSFLSKNLQRSYPDVPVFRSYKSMIQEFPPSGG